MRLAVMQPYFLPYIGYYQLLHQADIFVIYDRIKYVKGGWVNRNRILQNGGPAYITLPLHKASDAALIDERLLSEDFPQQKKKLLNKIRESYRTAPFFDAVFPLVEEILTFGEKERNLFVFLSHSLRQTADYLGIDPGKIKTYSDLKLPDPDTMYDRLFDICRHYGAQEYVNPPGGIEIYDPARFTAAGITLRFLMPENITYAQKTGKDFVPHLSILDVMMFNDQATIRRFLDCYSYHSPMVK